MSTMSNSSKSPIMDLSIFKNDSQINKQCNKYESCICVLRLLSSLKYYATLNVSQKKEDQDIFMNFIKEVYTQTILDDYQHLCKCHGHELEDILSFGINKFDLAPCNIDECAYSDRRYRVNNGNNNNSKDTNFDDHDLYFYIDIMDSFHFHLYHLYDVGLRVSTKEAIDDEKDEEIKSDDPYFDAVLSRNHKEISNKRKSATRFERISNNSSKFTIKTDSKVDDDEGMTRLDSIYHQLSSEPYAVEQDLITELKEYVKQELFDTESMDCDLNLCGKTGNIAGSTSKHCGNSLINMFEAYRGMILYILCTLFYYLSIFGSIHIVSSGSVSIGFMIHYFDDNKPSGAHDSFKEEMLNYFDITANTINRDSIPKANQYVKSKMAKSMRANYTAYGIPKDAPIGTDHLIAVILYTDYTKISSHFTASFRKKNPFENENQVKRRNMKYWCWGRKLKEVMWCYGDTGRVWGGSLIGPFFTGMDRVMTLPLFNIYLYSPTSTSVELAVSQNFCGDNGMIMSFNNDEGAATNASGFDCSWLSRFKEEDERYDALNHVNSIKLYDLYVFRLFFQADLSCPFNISSIRTLKTGAAKNYEYIAKPITVFDACISGRASIPRADPSNKYGKVITQLINAQITGKAGQIDQYILDTFNSFIKHKKKIGINFGFVVEKVKDKELINNIINIPAVTEYKHGQTEFIERTQNDITNLLNTKIIKIFTNVEEILITINEWKNNNNIYTISLIGLLSVIESNNTNGLLSTSIEKVTILMKWKSDEISWLRALWKESSEELIEEYNDMGFDIKQDNNSRYDKIIINKL